jgi:DNA-binding CsgD family transcriptional regulator
MRRLSPAGVDRLLALVGDVNGLGSLEAFRTGLLDALDRAVPSLYVSYNEVDAHGAWAFSRPALPPGDVPRWAALADGHPVLQHMRETRDGRPRRISDHLDGPSFRRTALYRGFYAELGIDSQVAFGLPAAPPLVIGIALSRSGEDFSDEEVELLARARPHLIQAYRTAQAADRRQRSLEALERGLESEGRLAVGVTREGEVVHAGPAARRALGLADPGPGRTVRLEQGLGRAVAAARAGGPSRVPAAVTGSVPVRVLPGGADDELDVLLVDQGAGGLTVERLLGLGLTPREAEALRWIALGRTAPDASRAMGIAPRTVSKHLQAVYAKLGVSSRSEAARTAWLAVDDRG